MFRFPIAVAALLCAACSAADPAPRQNQARFVPPQPPEAPQPVPENAPSGAGIRNVAATAGKANRRQTPAPFALTRMATFDNPFAMAFLPDGTLLVTEKGGALKLRGVDGRIQDVRGVPPVAPGGQGGLLDVVPAPDFATSRTIYFTFSAQGDKGSALALARGKLEGVAAPALTGVETIWLSGSNGPGGQFGAKIAFSPDGRFLFLSSGDRQRFTPAQDPRQLLGKIVRLTLDGAAAPGNPAAAKGGVEAMTWTSGHRNPYGLVFAPDGRLWEVEMGPQGGDELNLLEPGRNYGWPLVSNGDNYSGQPIPDHPSRPEFHAPALWWNPSISPSSMSYYSGDLFPAIKGSLLIGHMSRPGLVRVSLAGGTPVAADDWDVNGMRIRDVAQGPDGAIWLLEDGSKDSAGRLFRAVPK